MEALLSEKIAALRKNAGYTQADLARELKVTRAAVNSWEMGISLPKTRTVLEMAEFFHVSTDYLFGMGDSQSIDLTGLSERDVQLVIAMVENMRKLERCSKNRKEDKEMEHSGA